MELATVPEHATADPPYLKTCRTCGEAKPGSEFNRLRNAPDGLRYHCRECERGIKRAWHAANRERAASYARDYYATHKTAIRKRAKVTARAYYAARKDELKQKARRWYRENTERAKAASLAWRKAHPEQHAANRRRRQLAAKNAPGRATPAQIQARIAYYGGRCWVCRVAPYEGMDHVKPLAAGGANWPANLRPICLVCNSRKGDKWPFRPADIEEEGRDDA